MRPKITGLTSCILHGVLVAAVLTAGEMKPRSPAVMLQNLDSRLERVKRQFAREARLLPPDPEHKARTAGVSGRGTTGPAAVVIPTVYGATIRNAEKKLRDELRREGLTRQNLLFVDRTILSKNDANNLPESAGVGMGAIALTAIAASQVPVAIASCEIAAKNPTASVEVQASGVFEDLTTCLRARNMSYSDLLTCDVAFDDLLTVPAGGIETTGRLRVSAVAARF